MTTPRHEKLRKQAFWCFVAAMLIFALAPILGEIASSLVMTTEAY